MRKLLVDEHNRKRRIGISVAEIASTQQRNIQRFEVVNIGKDKTCVGHVFLLGHGAAEDGEILRPAVWGAGPGSGYGDLEHARYSAQTFREPVAELSSACRVGIAYF